MYPTKEQILTQIHISQPLPKHIAIVKEWKNENYTSKWRSKTTAQKQKSVEELLQKLWKSIHNQSKKNISVTWDAVDGWFIEVDTLKIHGQNPSIISALHELGHALYGPSELHACVFSIGIFMKCFPHAYAKLEWNGHMLQAKSN